MGELRRRVKNRERKREEDKKKDKKDKEKEKEEKRKRKRRRWRRRRIQGIKTRERVVCGGKRDEDEIDKDGRLCLDDFKIVKGARKKKHAGEGGVN